MASEFWNERVSNHGHTGYKDQIIYAYDQLARLKTIESITASLDCKREFALDFGTGTGDFANLLARDIQRVLAFDISEKVIGVAKRKYADTPNIRFVNGQSKSRSGKTGQWHKWCELLYTKQLKGEQ